MRNRMVESRACGCWLRAAPIRAFVTEPFGARRRGFTLVELLVVISLMALLIGILLPAIAEVRRLGRMAVCQSNLRQMSVGGSNYAAEYQDLIYGFTWRQGHQESQFADLRSQAAMSNLTASAAQAVDIMRRRAGRSDIQPIHGWIPTVLYSHLVLQDYMAVRLPEPVVVCPEDEHRRDWQRGNGRLFDAGTFLPTQPAPTPFNKRWVYSSSYMATASAWDYWQSHDPRMARRNAYGHEWSAAGRRTYTADGMPCEGCVVPFEHRFGGTSMAQVMFPSQKVHQYDKVDRHFGRDLYALFRDARQPLLFFDGSVRVYTTAETNRGWHPLYGNTARTMEWTYIGQGPWDPRPRPDTVVDGHFRWTRGGLRGVDVGGPEIDTGQQE